MKKLLLVAFSSVILSTASHAVVADAYTDFTVNDGLPSYAAGDGGLWYPYTYGFNGGGPSASLLGNTSQPGYTIDGALGHYPQILAGSGFLELRLYSHGTTVANDYGAGMIYANTASARTVQIQGSFALGGGLGHGFCYIQSNINGNLWGLAPGLSPLAGDLNSAGTTSVSFDFSYNLAASEQVWFWTSSVTTGATYDSINNPPTGAYVAFNGSVIPEPSALALLMLPATVCFLRRKFRIRH